MHSILRQPVNGFGSIGVLSPADSEVRAKEGLWADPSFTSNATVTKKYKCGASDAALESRAQSNVSSSTPLCLWKSLLVSPSF